MKKTTYNDIKPPKTYAPGSFDRFQALPSHPGAIGIEYPWLESCSKKSSASPENSKAF